jgi:RNA polymerase primary sigma factor
VPDMSQYTSPSASQPFTTYLRNIDETPLLSAREEKELAGRIGEGDPEARDHLVRANLRLVVNIARGYANKGLALEDLIAEGNLGLLRAAEGFDPAMETRFSTYAAYWIKQSMKRAIVNTAKTVRVPAYMAELMVKWRRAATKLQEELGRQPTEEEIGARLGLSAKKLKIIRKALRISGASAPGCLDEGAAPVEEAADTRPSPTAAISGAEELQQVLDLLDQLEEREAMVLRLRFGLSGEDPKTLKEIGERLGLTRERVRQIETESLRKLREGIEGF